MADPRVARTKKWLKNALLELIEEKEYKKIAVSEITDRAELSRPTFYLHYKTKDDLLLDIFRVINEEHMQNFDKMRNNASIEDPGYNTMVNTLKTIEQHRKIYQVIAETGKEALLIEETDRMQKEYLRDLARRCEMEIDERVIKYCSQFFAGAYSHMLITWITSEERVPPEEISRVFMGMFRPVLRYAICNGEMNYLFME